MIIRKLVSAASALTIAISAFAGLTVTANADTDTLQNIINNTTSGGTVTLTQNYTEDITIESGKTITLDLSGYKITNVSGDTITNSGTLTVMDSSTDKTGKVDNTTTKKAALLNHGTAYLNGGTIERSKEDGSNNTYWTIYNNKGELTVDGAAIKNAATYSACLESDGIETDTATVTIKSGTITAGSYSVKNDEYSTLTITGGTIESTSGTAVLNYNVADITGGEIKGANTAVWSRTGTGDGVAGTVTVSGDASLTGATYGVYVSNSGTAAISGGTVTATDSTSGCGVMVNSGTVTVSGDAVVTSAASGIIADGTGSATVSGGTVTGDTIGVYVAGSGAATVSGGTVTGECALYAAGTGSVTVTDGTIHGDVAVNPESSGKISVSGGDFDADYYDDVLEYLADGCTMVATTDSDGKTVYEAVSTSGDNAKTMSYTFDKKLSDFTNGSATLTVKYSTDEETKTGTATLDSKTTFTGEGTVGIAVILTNIPDNSVIESVTLD